MCKKWSVTDANFGFGLNFGDKSGNINILGESSHWTFGQLSVSPDSNKSFSTLIATYFSYVRHIRKVGCSGMTDNPARLRVSPTFLASRGHTAGWTSRLVCSIQHGMASLCLLTHACSIRVDFQASGDMNTSTPVQIWSECTGPPRSLVTLQYGYIQLCSSVFDWVSYSQLVVPVYRLT